jgi:hypothetical protein
MLSVWGQKKSLERVREAIREESMNSGGRKFVASDYPQIPGGPDENVFAELENLGVDLG